MVGLLDLFAIGFNSEGLKDFETNLKNNEKELDKYEKQVKDLEKKLAELEAAEEKDVKAIAQVKSALEEARGNVEKFKKSVETMKGKSEYSLLQIQKSFKNIASAVVRMAVVGAAVRKSLKFYEQAEQLDFLAQKTGIATEKLQELANAAKKYGGTTEGSASSVENIRTNKEEYKKYGIQVSNDPTQTLENVAKKMQTLKTDAQKLDMANALGLDEGTTRLLIQGAERYREELKRTSKYKLYTKEDIERMRDYRQTQQDIRMGLENIFGAIYRMLLPAITAVSKVIRTVTDWIVEHQDIAKIIGIIALVSGGIAGLTALLPILGKAFLGLSRVLLTTPFGWVVTAIVTIILVINDLIVFMQGGDSVIGRLFEKWGIDADKWRKILSTAFENIKKDFLALVERLKTLGAELKEKLDKIMPEWMKNFFKRNGALYNIMKKGGEQIIQYNNRQENAIPARAVSNYNQTQAINTNNNANTKSINNSKKSTKNVKIDNVTIQTQATDAKGIASDLDVISEFDDGIMI